MIRRDDETGEYLGIGCDECGTHAPSAKEIAAAHGLIRLGWYCAGGTHICPDHDHPAYVGRFVKPVVPQSELRL